MNKSKNYAVLRKEEMFVIFSVNLEAHLILCKWPRTLAKNHLLEN